MDRVQDLHPLPPVVVIVLVEDEVGRLPAGGEERVVALVVRHVREFVDLRQLPHWKHASNFGFPFSAGYFIIIDVYGTPGPPAPRSDMS